MTTELIVSKRIQELIQEYKERQGSQFNNGVIHGLKIIAQVIDCELDQLSKDLEELKATCSKVDDFLAEEKNIWCKRCERRIDVNKPHTCMHICAGCKNLFKESEMAELSDAPNCWVCHECSFDFETCGGDDPC